MSIESIKYTIKSLEAQLKAVEIRVAVQNKAISAAEVDPESTEKDERMYKMHMALSEMFADLAALQTKISEGYRKLRSLNHDDD